MLKKVTCFVGKTEVVENAIDRVMDRFLPYVVAGVLVELVIGTVLILWCRPRFVSVKDYFLILRYEIDLINT